MAHFFSWFQIPLSTQRAKLAGVSLTSPTYKFFGSHLGRNSQRASTDKSNRFLHNRLRNLTNLIQVPV
jgi:hypothetical protein